MPINRIGHACAIVTLALCTSGTVLAGATQYRFERLWPVLQQPWYFLATGLAVDDQGFIYLADFNAARVQKFTLQGQYITQWGSQGSGPGQFATPQSVVVDSNGDVYVADRSNNRIQKFTSNGEYLTEFGTAGSGPGQISLPRYIAIDGLDAIYVIELGNSRVSKFIPPGGEDPSQPHVFDFSFGGPGLGPGEFTTIATAVVHETGDIFVASHGGDRIQKFNPDGIFQLQFGSLGNDPGQFRNPRGLAINPADELLVGDSNNRIQVFDLNGIFLRQISPIAPPPAFLAAGDIDILPSGELVLANLFTGDVVKTSSDGAVQSTFSSQGSLPGRFQNPTDIALDPAGQLVVVNSNAEGGTRYQTFDSNGQYLFEYRLPENISALDIRADGRIYAAGGAEIFGYDPPASGLPEDPPELTFTTSDSTFLSKVVVVGNEGLDQLLVDVDNLGFTPPALGSLNTEVATTQSIAHGDFDADNQVDFVYGRNGQNGILIGDFPLSNNTTFGLSADTDDTRAVVVLDADGDGDEDIVTGNAGAPNRLFVNDGAANFTAAGSLGNTSDDTRALAVADIDGNGTQDVFVGNALGQSLIYLNNGTGVFTPGPVIGGATETILAAGFVDLDRNGSLDLVVARNGTNQIYRNSGGVFSPPQDLSSDHNDSRALAFIDVNLDSFADVVVGNFNQINRYYLNDGTGTVWSGVDLGSESEPTTSLAAYLDNIDAAVIAGNNGVPNRAHYVNQFDRSSPLSLSLQMPDEGVVNTLALEAVDDLSQRRFGSLTNASNLVLSSRDQLYVADFQLQKIVRFNADGIALAETTLDPEPGQASIGFNAIAVDDDERLFVADFFSNRVFQFAPPADLNGSGSHTLETSFGEPGTGDGQLNGPSSIQLLSSGNLAVADRGTRVQLFTPQGQFISSFGQFGSTPGAFGSINLGAEMPDGRLPIVDQRFSRVQTFSPQAVTDNTKVIVVAGGGPYPGNALWDATQNNANFAYRVLVSQGFTKDTIFYLSDDTDLDLDGNGLPDDVDGAASVANLNLAFNTFAADADNLIVYLIDHGGMDTFRMSGTQTLSAGALGSLFDTWQGAGASRRITAIYDACQSGSFLEETLTDQFDRIVITSSGAEQNAYFVSQGTLSFSNQFWTHIFNGLSLEDAYTLASQTQSTSFPEQTPMVEADGDGMANTSFDLARLSGQFIGNGTQIFGEVPTVGTLTVSPPTGSSATVDVMDVMDDDGIGRVWMVLRPPGFNPGSPDNPVQDLPTVELAREAGTDNYSATFNGFTSAGTYQITVYAQDAVGNTAVPEVAFLTIDNPLRRKAIIVAGGEPSDPKAGAINVNASLAYNALLQQGYGPDGRSCNLSLCDDVQYLSNTGVAGLDAAATLSNLQFAITDWATQDGQDLVLYLVGSPATDGFRLNSGEVLTPSLLSSWLDTAQQALPGALVVIYDGELSGAFVPALMAPVGRDRIVIASDGDTLRCNLVLDEDVSFSRYFWGQVLNGSTVRQAFNLARQGMRFSERSQTALLDDNGNGVANEFTDGLFARSYSLGSGVLLAGDEPLVGSITAPASISGVTAVELVANGVTSTGQIMSVEAIVTLPTCEEVRLPMQNEGSGRYSVQTQIFSDFSGIHDVAIVARDDEGLSSLPAAASIDQRSGSLLFSDGFESP